LRVPDLAAEDEMQKLRHGGSLVIAAQ
jgi:hypothetical protein